MKRKNLLLQWIVILTCAVLLPTGCADKNKTTDNTDKYSAVTRDLIDIVEGDAQLKALLEKAIANGKAINPDTITNPAQTLDKYYEFIEHSVKAMPWSVLNLPDSTYSIFNKINQALCYLCFINGMPLEELEGQSLCTNSIQYTEPYRTWLIDFTKAWGEYLSTTDSWNDEYLKAVQADPDFGLQKGWYEDPSNWKTFNDFFARELSSPAARPIAEPDNDAVVVSYADSEPEGVWAINDSSQIVQKEGVAIKSKAYNSVADLIGPNSKYRDAFAGGTLTHSFLNVHDYHWYHFAMGGTIKEINVIPGDDAIGGYITWNEAEKRYMVDCSTPGWQTIETRGCVIVETEQYGLVALLPVGMSQVSSVNFDKSLKVGDKVKKGDKLGYFLFGGSDFAMVFQRGVKFELTAPTNDKGRWEHILMGEELGRLTKE
ncbi:MAG: phosphatidylserine decarboxylase [Bacteroidales bacterium]|nr:phosphatidylserine decarboxylase [Bacteroidales bacterium]